MSYIALLKHFKTLLSKEAILIDGLIGDRDTSNDALE